MERPMLLLLVLAHLVFSVTAVWHNNQPHNHRASPICTLAESRGLSDCSAGQHCGVTNNLKWLQGHSQYVLPPFEALPDRFGWNCTHLTCGCKVDGVGSQMQGRLSAYAYAQAKGMKYMHFPMARSHGHFSSEAEEMHMVDAVEGFFNLGFEEEGLEAAADPKVLACAVEHCHVFMDLGGESCYDDIKPKIRRKYDSSPKPAPLHNPSMITLAVHVRRGDVSVVENGERYSPNQYYVDTLSAIKKSLPPWMQQKLDIVILSEGSNASEFAAITSAHPTARLVLSGDLLQVIHTMVTADILILAHSSFSYVAALYNTGLIVYNHFWHSPPKSWLLNPWPPLPMNETADGKEDVPCRLLMQTLKTPAIHTFLENQWSGRNALHL